MEKLLQFSQIVGNSGLRIPDSVPDSGFLLLVLPHANSPRGLGLDYIVMQMRKTDCEKGYYQYRVYSV